ncbi:MAG: transporter substrate-binding domain-containing protein [Deltaproteobacteria bacterium]|nr:transporter substrate-binding domain-containing protein [Deltaproteobacteria bacterium]
MRWTAFLLPLIFIFYLTSQVFAAEVRIGVDNNPPLTFIDAAGRADGLLPNLLQQMAEENRWTLTIVPCQWQQCLEKLENGQIDILPAIAYTEERAKSYRFAEETVFNSWGQVYQRPGKNYDSILQLEGKKLAVLSGDVYFTGAQGLVQVAENFGININFIEVSSYQEAFTKLARGEVDAAMVDRIFGIKQRQKFNLLPSSIMIKPVQVRPAFSPFAPAGIKAQFDRSLATWQQTTDSTYYQLLEEWLGEEMPRRVPSWLKGVIYTLIAFLCLLLPATIWTRQQVKRKTRQLAEKNRQLEDELIERQRVEIELRERQQQYHVLFEETQAIMLLIDPKTAEIVDANPAACSFYHYPRETMQGMKIGQLNGLSEQQIQTTIDQIEARQLQQFELVHKLADGEERQVEIQSSPIIVKGRSLICSIVRDINERKNAERKIAERNAFLQSVIDGVSDPLMVIDFDFQILQMNRVAREQAGLRLSSPKALSCHQLSHASAVPCNGEDHPCPIRQVQETGQPVTVIHNHLKNRQSRIVELNVSPLYDTAAACAR